MRAQRFWDYKGIVAGHVGVITQALFQIANKDADITIASAPGRDAHRLLQIDLVDVQVRVHSLNFI
jgi:hypothetical protein